MDGDCVHCNRPYLVPTFKGLLLRAFVLIHIYFHTYVAKLTRAVMNGHDVLLCQMHPIHRVPSRERLFLYLKFKLLALCFRGMPQKDGSVQQLNISVRIPLIEQIEEWVLPC